MPDALPPAAWAAILLVGAWLAAALLLAWGRWGARRLASVPAPPCFRAPPRTGGGSADRARLAFLGDMQRGVADVARPLARLVAERPVDLLVSSGDFVSHAEAACYGLALDAFTAAGVETPVRVVPGNHDLFPRRVRDPSRGAALFEARFGPRWWAERVGPVLVVGVDDAVAPPDAAQMRWLEATLAERAGAPWVLVCHRPPRRVDLPGAPPSPGLEALVEATRRHPPALVVSGHWHRPAEALVDGVPWVVNPLGGDVHRAPLGLGRFEVLWATVHADGRVERETVRPRRRPWLRVLLHQLQVRLDRESRRPLGRLLAFPLAFLRAAPP
jgi:predicted phosphodiesterase